MPLSSSSDHVDEPLSYGSLSSASLPFSSSSLLFLVLGESGLESGSVSSAVGEASAPLKVEEDIVLEMVDEDRVVLEAVLVVLDASLDDVVAAAFTVDVDESTAAFELVFGFESALTEGESAVSGSVLAGSLSVVEVVGVVVSVSDVSGAVLVSEVSGSVLAGSLSVEDVVGVVVSVLEVSGSVLVSGVTGSVLGVVVSGSVFGEVVSVVPVLGSDSSEDLEDDEEDLEDLFFGGLRFSKSSNVSDWPGALATFSERSYPRAAMSKSKRFLKKIRQLTWASLMGGQLALGGCLAYRGSTSCSALTMPAVLTSRPRTAAERISNNSNKVLWSKEIMNGKWKSKTKVGLVDPVYGAKTLLYLSNKSANEGLVLVREVRQEHHDSLTTGFIYGRLCVNGVQNWP